MTRFLIDEVFDICQDDAIVPGQRENLERHNSATRARETWKHLDRLRKKSYIRVGWQVEAHPEAGPSGIYKPDARMNRTNHTKRSAPQRGSRSSTSGSYAPLDDAHSRGFTLKSPPAPQQVWPSSRSQSFHGTLPMMDFQTAEDEFTSMSPKWSKSSFGTLCPSPMATPTTKGNSKASIGLDDLIWCDQPSTTCKHARASENEIFPTSPSTIDYDDFTSETEDAILQGDESIIIGFPSLESEWFMDSSGGTGEYGR